MTTEEGLAQLLTEARQREREFHELRLWTERGVHVLGRALLKRDEKNALVDRLATIGAYAAGAQRELITLIRDLEGHQRALV